jgi:hypothetical protein
VLGPEHPMIPVTKGKLAKTYRKLGQYEDAKNLEIEVAELMAKVLGPEHPDTLTEKGNLAVTSSGTL